MLSNNIVRRGVTRSLVATNRRGVVATNLSNDVQKHDCELHERRRLFSIARLQVPLQDNYNNTINSTDATIYQLRQRRSMVMVTKTKVAELPSDDVGDDNTSITNSDNTAPTYVTHSDSLIVTPSCLQRVEKLIQHRKDQDNTESEDFFLRVFVDAGGCSGFQYQFEIDSDFDEEEGDMVVVSAATSSGSSTLHPRIVVDQTSLGFLEGSTLDYVIEMIKSAFVVKDNPKSESACGCGSSFAMKNFEANPAMD